MVASATDSIQDLVTLGKKDRLFSMLGQGNWHAEDGTANKMPTWNMGQGKQEIIYKSNIDKVTS